jgi:type VI secretion system protein ImpA
MLDLLKLLEPLGTNQRGGISLLYEGTHQELMEARRDDNPSLPRGDWSRPLKVSDWQKVIDLATHTLKEKSKDLRVAVMLSEALIYQEGIIGFNAATNFLIKFMELYWDDMHPLIDEPADLESRMLILEWFSEKCGLAIKFQYITAPISNHLAYNMVDWLKVEKLLKAGPTKLTRRQRLEPQQENTQGPTIQSFEESITATPTNWLRSNKEIIQETSDLIGQLEKLITEKMRNNIPNFRPLKDAIEQIHSKSQELIQVRDQVEGKLEDRTKEIQSSEAAEIEQVKVGTQTTTTTSTNGSSINNKVLKTDFVSRAEAYDTLEVISKYLMDIDPHSPTPYLLRKAVSFRDMTFADLLTTLVDDEWHRSNLLKLMGVGNTDQKSNKME